VAPNLVVARIYLLSYLLPTENSVDFKAGDLGVIYDYRLVML